MTAVEVLPVVGAVYVLGAIAWVVWCGYEGDDLRIPGALLWPVLVVGMLLYGLGCLLSERRQRVRVEKPDAAEDALMTNAVLMLRMRDALIVAAGALDKLRCNRQDDLRCGQDNTSDFPCARCSAREVVIAALNEAFGGRP